LYKGITKPAVETDKTSLLFEMEVHCHLISNPENEGGHVLRFTFQRAFGPDPMVIEMPFEYPIEFMNKTKARNAAHAGAISFRTHLPFVVAHESSLHLADMMNLALDEFYLREIDRADIVNSHIKQTALRIRTLLKSPEPGQRSEWDRLELMHALRRVMHELPASQRTFEIVARKLREITKRETPGSGEALRKLISRFGLKWKELKAFKPDSLDPELDSGQNYENL
jgi:hypothetical protein